MPILRTNKTATENRVKKSSVEELEKLVRLAKERGYTIASFTNTKYPLTLPEHMLLDSAFKELPLMEADVTLLILPDRYVTMLHKLTWIIMETISK